MIVHRLRNNVWVVSHRWQIFNFIFASNMVEMHISTARPHRNELSYSVAFSPHAPSKTNIFSRQKTLFRCEMFCLWYLLPKENPKRHVNGVRNSIRTSPCLIYYIINTWNLSTHSHNNLFSVGYQTPSPFLLVWATAAVIVIMVIVVTVDNFGFVVETYIYYVFDSYWQYLALHAAQHDLHAMLLALKC